MNIPTAAALAKRVDECLHRVRARLGMPFAATGRARSATEAGGLPWESVPERHFAELNNHINFTSMRDSVLRLGGAPATILETGSSAWGTNSTALWDAYVQTAGGRVWSVDIRRQPSRILVDGVSPQTTLTCDDSVTFLRRWARRHPQEVVNLVYLDSWDVSFRSPMPAAIHCLHEFLAIESHLRDGSLLLIDDSPGASEWVPDEFRDQALAFHARHGIFPGKGMLVDLLLQLRPNVRKIHHRYQVLYEFLAC